MTSAYTTYFSRTSLSWSARLSPLMVASPSRSVSNVRRRDAGKEKEQEHRPHATHVAAMKSTDDEKHDASPPKSFWRTLLDVRNWGLAELGTAATILCAIDCTVFPVILAVLPVMKFMDSSTSQYAAQLAHHVSLFIVIPIGSLAVATNFLQHKRADIATLGALGVSAVAATHLDWLPSSALVYDAWINTTGCALLLTSGWLSHRVLHGDEDDNDQHHGSSQKSKSAVAAPSCHIPRKQ